MLSNNKEGIFCKVLTWLNLHSQLNKDKDRLNFNIMPMPKQKLKCLILKQLPLNNMLVMLEAK